MINFNNSDREIIRVARNCFSMILMTAAIIFSIQFTFADNSILVDKMTISNQLDYLVKEHGLLKRKIKRLQQELKQLKLSVVEIHSENSDHDLNTISTSESAALMHQTEVLQEQGTSTINNPQAVMNNNQKNFDPASFGHQEKQKSEKFITETELKFSKQKYIPDWSENTARLIEIQFNDIDKIRASSGVSVKNVDCRESICRVEIPYQNIDILEEIEMEFLIKVSDLLPIAIISRSTDSDGRLNAIYYLSQSYDNY